jgi:Fic family protein
VPSPAFRLTPRLLGLAADVSRLVGRFEGLQVPKPQLRLRRLNRARSLQASTAIEGNTLSLEQVTALLDGQTVLAPRREILEVQNALAVYEKVTRLRPWSERDLLRAHALMMRALAADAGRYRTRDVGVLKGSKVAHVAPPHRLVPRLVANLLDWGRNEPDTPVLIKACVVHYELEFIHPFTDGNGRIGRLWQLVVLLGVSPIFEFAPIESMIHARQGEYYRALSESDRAGDCGPFILFSLEAIRDTLLELLGGLRPEVQTAEHRLELAREQFSGRWFSRGDYLSLHKKLSTATASRDLQRAVVLGLARRRGADRNTEYAFKVSGRRPPRSRRN